MKRKIRKRLLNNFYENQESYYNEMKKICDELFTKENYIISKKINVKRKKIILNFEIEIKGSK